MTRLSVTYRRRHAVLQNRSCPVSHASGPWLDPPWKDSDDAHLQINEKITAQMSMIELSEKDLEIVRSIRPLVLEHIDEIVDSFYDSVLRVDILKKLILEHSQIEKLRKTLKKHLIEMFSGRIDPEFIEKRMRIAIVHERIGLKTRWYMGAFQNLQNAFIHMLNLHMPDKERMLTVCLSITKLLNLEQQLVLEAYEKRSNEKIQHQAFHDELTGLPNRRMLQKRLQERIGPGAEAQGRFAVMVLDIDRFKMINDSLGHAYGDQFLKMVSSRLLEAAGEASSFIARMGGDEFAVLSPADAEHDSAELAMRIIEQIRLPYQLNRTEFFVTTSIGIAIYPEHGVTASELLRNADKAMYEVKKDGKNDYQFYSAAFDAHLQEKIELENDLRKAVARQELVVHYQPQYTLKENQLIGVEALMRWNHPRKGLLDPSVFIPIAEETGMIYEMGAWILREACRQMQAWHDEGGPQIRVSVNLSTQQFHQSNLCETIRGILEETGLPPEYLELEITESMMMDVTRSTQILQELTALGVYISMDDFGTGYSSLSYLKLFPIRKLKIDRSFMKDVMSNPNDKAIVATIISMAHHLNMRVIAEGVETEDQLQYLIENGCDDIQGFFFSPPVTAEQLQSTILSGK
ncbi:putative bifunctional diguanylate cyclase/phosphodiesterase [Paenibacillus dendritiformis]|uniref:putative bifunctional diguanylate cyclase/phosphodiesterase n=1 Tax=Paenibacillus dendritiformis TaxID=130049 RepID=UPI002467C978|nr:EAL domain-containing protein [Paenibacillus dendritiformis]